jgi:hypothetical protein
LWGIVVAVLVAVVLVAAVFLSYLGNGRIEIHTRAGAGPDQSKTLPVDRCAQAPAQAIDGITEQLRSGTELGRVVVLRPSKSSYVIAAGTVTTSPDLERLGIGGEVTSVWIFENGIGATARPTDYISKVISKKVAPVPVEAELSERVVRCLGTKD